MRDVPEISDMVPKFKETPNLVKIHVSAKYDSRKKVIRARFVSGAMLIFSVSFQFYRFTPLGRQKFDVDEI